MGDQAVCMGSRLILTLFRSVMGNLYDVEMMAKNFHLAAIVSSCQTVHGVGDEGNDSPWNYGKEDLLGDKY